MTLGGIKNICSEDQRDVFGLNLYWQLSVFTSYYSYSMLTIISCNKVAILDHSGVEYDHYVEFIHRLLLELRGLEKNTYGLQVGKIEIL